MFNTRILKHFRESPANKLSPIVRLKYLDLTPRMILPSCLNDVPHVESLVLGGQELGVE